MKHPKTVLAPMACGVILTAAALLLPPCAAAAQPADDSRDLVERVEAIYKPGARSMAESGTSLIKEVERRWESLPEDARRRLASLIEEPVVNGPGAPDGQKTLETEHFKVHFAGQGADAPAGGEAYAKEVAGYLEKAWQVEVGQYGFAEPPSAKNRIAVHLRKINHNGLTHASTGLRSWIELNSDIVGYTKGLLGDEGAKSITSDPAGPQAGLLKACVAHEFFHCIQASYDWDEANWWCEGTAEWMGDAVFPESKFYCNNVKPRFEKPETSLFSKKGWFEYASSLWAFYVAENLGGADAIKKIWEGCRGTGTVRTATEAVVGDLQEQYEYFACYAYLRNFADGKRFPQMKAATVAAIPGTASSQADSAPEGFGANYAVVPVDAGRASVSLALKITGKQAAGARVVAIRNSKWQILPATLQGGSLTAEVPGGNGLTKLIVVICGFDESGSSGWSLAVK